MLDNCMLVFFVVGVIMKEISAVMTWFTETVKSFENLNHPCSCNMDHVFLLHSSSGSLKQFLVFLEVLILTKFSCSLSIVTIKGIYVKNCKPSIPNCDRTTKLHKLESSVGYFCEAWSDLFIL